MGRRDLSKKIVGGANHFTQFAILFVRQGELAGADRIAQGHHQAGPQITQRRDKTLSGQRAMPVRSRVKVVAISRLTKDGVKIIAAMRAAPVFCGVRTAYW